MSIQKEFLVRYRAEGHVRFEIPPRACLPEVASQLILQVAAIDGVFAVKLFRQSRKLSIRYDAAASSFAELARRLFDVLAVMESEDWFAPQAIVPLAKKNRVGVKQRFRQSRVGRWFGEKVAAVQETAQAAKIIGKLAGKGPKALVKDPEKAVIDFLNDILVLYLIKVHWNRITQEWLVRPIVHRYEWMATFYMFFLLVRSRKPK